MSKQAVIPQKDSFNSKTQGGDYEATTFISDFSKNNF